MMRWLFSGFQELVRDPEYDDSHHALGDALRKMLTFFLLNFFVIYEMIINEEVVNSNYCNLTSSRNETVVIIQLNF